jgi:hypothetical protein
MGISERGSEQFLCQAYLSRALKAHYDPSAVCDWLEVPLDSQVVNAIQERRRELGFEPPPKFQSIKSLDSV